MGKKLHEQLRASERKPPSALGSFSEKCPPNCYMNHHEIALIYIYTYHCGLVLFVTPQILANMEQSKDYGGSIQTIHKDTQATPSSHRFLRWSRPAIFNGWEKHSMSSCAPLNASRPQLWVPFQNKQCPPNCCMNHHEIALIYIYIYTYHCGLVHFVTPQILANMEQSKDYNGSIQTIHKDTQATPSSHRFLRWSRPAIFNGWEKTLHEQLCASERKPPSALGSFSEKCPLNCCMNHHEIALPHDAHIYI